MGCGMKGRGWSYSLLDTHIGLMVATAIVRTNAPRMAGCSCLEGASKHFNSITLSTAKYEFMVAKEATLHAIHLRYLLEEMGVEVMEPTPLHADNTTAITLSVTENRSRRM